MVPTRCKGQRPILFGRVECKPTTYEDSKSETELPQFSHYESNVLRMMKNMGYDLTSGPGLNFSKGRRTLLWSFVPKGKAPDYYHQTRRGLGYVSTPIPLASESERVIILLPLIRHVIMGVRCQCRQHLQRTFSKHGFNKDLKDRDEEIIQSDIYSWIKHLNTLWNICFEQRETPQRIR